MLLLSASLAGCSSWVFRIDVPQGNFLDQDDIDQLRIGMTKEQVMYVMGKPMVRDTFDNDVFYYFYNMKAGSITEEDFRKEFYVYFENDRVSKVGGDYEVPETFYTPLEQ